MGPYIWVHVFISYIYNYIIYILNTCKPMFILYYIHTYTIIYFFFARAVLVRDLRPLALPYCSKDYGKAKSGEKRISLRTGEIKNRQCVQDSIKQEFMYTYRSTKEYWQIDIWFSAWRITHRRFTQSSFTQSSVQKEFDRTKMCDQLKGVYKKILNYA